MLSYGNPDVGSAAEGVRNGLPDELGDGAVALAVSAFGFGAAALTIVAALVLESWSIGERWVWQANANAAALKRQSRVSFDAGNNTAAP